MSEKNYRHPSLDKNFICSVHVDQIPAKGTSYEKVLPQIDPKDAEESSKAFSTMCNSEKVPEGFLKKYSCTDKLKFLSIASPVNFSLIGLKKKKLRSIKERLGAVKNLYEYFDSFISSLNGGDLYVAKTCMEIEQDLELSGEIYVIPQKVRIGSLNYIVSEYLVRKIPVGTSPFNTTNFKIENTSDVKLTEISSDFFDLISLPDIGRSIQNLRKGDVNDKTKRYLQALVRKTSWSLLKTLASDEPNVIEKMDEIEEEAKKIASDNILTSIYKVMDEKLQEMKIKRIEVGVKDGALLRDIISAYCEFNSLLVKTATGYVPLTKYPMVILH